MEYESAREPIGYHIILRLKDNRVIVPKVPERRELVRIICQQAQNVRLLAFCIADTHIHLEVLLNRIHCGELVRRIEISAARRLKLKVGFDEPYYKAIWNQSHLINTFDYNLNQAPHHELTNDPFFECTNLPDLLGLRLVGLFTVQHVRLYLPWIQRRDLLGYLGVSELPEVDVPPDIVVDAAAAAMALPDLLGTSREAILAKSAAAQVVGARLSPDDLSTLLGISARTMRRMRRSRVDKQLLKAVRLQMVLRHLKSNEAKVSTTFDASEHNLRR